jgi:hypothetical protein
MMKQKGAYMNNTAKEVLVGGLMGLIAVVAIFLKAFYGGFSTESVLEALIEVSSIGVTLMIFYTFLKGRIPTRDFEKSFRKKSQDWIESTMGLISITEEVKDENVIEEDKNDESYKEKNGFIRYSMIVNFNSYFLGNVSENSKKGEFIKLPSLNANEYRKGVEFKFYMNKSTMLSRLKADDIDKDGKVALERMSRLSGNIVTLLSRKFPDLVNKGTKTSKSLKTETTLYLKGDFTQPENLDKLFETFDYLMLLYAFAA